MSTAFAVQGPARTISYRRHTDRFGIFGGATLEQKLREAFDPAHPKKSHDCVANRSMGVRKISAVNYFSAGGRQGGADSYFYGELLSYERGAKQSYIEHQSNARYLTVAQMEAGDNKDWLNSIMYFFVKGDNVLAVQAPGSRFGDLQTYLQWLLTLHARVVPECYRIKLEEQIDLDAVGSDYEQIRAIRIRDPNSAAVAQRSLLRRHDAILSLDRDVTRRFGWRILQSVINFARNLEVSADVDYQRLSESYELKTDLSFRVEPNVSEHRREDVAALVQFISQLPEELVEFETPQGIIVDGKLRVTTTERFKVHPNTQHLDWEDAPKVFMAVYNAWVEGKRILP